MNQAWTKEPWHCAPTGPTMNEKYSQGFAIASPDDSYQLIAGCFHDVKGGHPQSKANAERIVQCVNACATIANPSAIYRVIGALKRIVEADRKDSRKELADAIEAAQYPLTAIERKEP